MIEEILEKQIFKLTKIKEKAMETENVINDLFRDYKKIRQVIADIHFLKQNAGIMLFAGRSGKIEEYGIIKEVRINDLSGCVVVPKLLLELATKKLEIIKAKMDTICYTKGGGL